MPNFSSLDTTIVGLNVHENSFWAADLHQGDQVRVVEKISGDEDSVH